MKFNYSKKNEIENYILEIKHIIDDWVEEQDICNEGPITGEDYCTIISLLTLILEVVDDYD